MKRRFDVLFESLITARSSIPSHTKSVLTSLICFADIQRFTDHWLVFSIQFTDRWLNISASYPALSNTSCLIRGRLP